MTDITINNILKKEIKELSSCYIFIAGDDYNINKITENFKKKLQDTNSDSFDFWVADAREDEFSSVLNNAYAMPFIALKKIIIYKYIENFKEEDLNKLKEYINSNNKFTCLCLFVKNKTVIKKIKNKNIEIIELKTIDKIDSLWIREFFKKNNKKINLSAVESLKIFFSDKNMFAVLNELEKILLYVGEKDIVTEEDIIENIRKVNIFNIFNLLDDISSGKSKDSIKKLNDILDSGVSSQEILAMFFWNFKRLWIALVMQESGHNLQNILEKVNVKAFVKDKFLSQLKRYNKNKLRNIFESLSKLEKSLKLNSVSDNLLMENFILSL